MYRKKFKPRNDRELITDARIQCESTRVRVRCTWEYREVTVSVS